MAHHVEPMDIDSDFDNKENSLHHNNVLPFTEKGYEELDVSELNMKLRYSVTPASSPMSKSYTANYTENRSLESGDDSVNVTVNENFNLSNSLNSTLTKNDNIIKSLKGLPLQAIPTEQFVDSNRNTSVLRSIDSPVTPNNNDITVTVSGPNDIDENLSLPSSSSSALHTPEATTPTKDIPLKDGGSPIIRGLKSVLNMFRSSQSPIPPVDNDGIAKQEMLSPAEVPLPDQESKSMLASTPIASHRKKEMSPTKRSSPQKDSSIVFNEDLEKELQWKDETTIIFSQERIPIHKLMLQQPPESKSFGRDLTDNAKIDIQQLNTTVEYMDISYNDSFRDRTMTEIQVDNAKVGGAFGGESDSEFVDCETTFSKNKSTIEDNDKTPIGNQTQDLNLTKEIENKNDSGSRLKQIVLDTTQDILDATLSVKPEDLLPEIFDQTKNVSELISNKTVTFDASQEMTVSKDIQERSASQVLQPVLNQTVDISNPIALEAKGNESQNLNCTKTIEVIHPINQTFDAASVLTPEEIEIECLNATKTIENVLGVTQTLQNSASNDTFCIKTAEAAVVADQNNQTFDITSTLADNVNKTENLNVTKTEENVLNLTQIVENRTSEDPNCTKTIEVITTTPTINQTFDTVSSLINEENLNITKTEENILGVTQVIENELSISENIDTQNTNTTIVVEDINNIASETISITDNVKNTNNELNTLNPILLEASIQPLPIPDDENDLVQDVTMTELPVDIPLPDEDDLDKELNLPTIITSEDTPLSSLPLDLVDDIKIIPNVNEISTTGIEPNLTLKSNNEEICAPIVASTVEDDNYIINDLVPNNLAETVKNDLNNAEKNSNDNEMSEINKKIENTNLSQEMALTLSNAAEDDEGVVDKEIEKNETKEINNELNVTVNLDKTVEQINENVISNETVDPIANDGNICELKPLPDIINQTIALSNAENLNTAISELETGLQDKVASNLENNDTNLSHEEIIFALDTKETEQQITNTVDIKPEDPIIEANTILEQQSSVHSNGDAIVSQDISGIVSDTANITVSEQIGDSIYSNKTDATTVESKLSTMDDREVPSDIDNAQQAVEQVNAKEVEEEIILSENNSPFVSVMADNIPGIIQSKTDIENVEETLATKSKVVLTPPSSPPIRSKGYNFNFDDMDFDPFATKTNIRMSPPVDSPDKMVNLSAQEKILEKPVPKKDINRRKSQPERKRPNVAASKRKFNASFDAKMNDKVIEQPAQKTETEFVKDIQLDAPATIALSPHNITIEEKDNEKCEIPPETVHIIETENVVQDKVEKPIEISTDASEKSSESHINELKASSSDQSTYFSAGTTSSESSIPSRNVFNLPEIDDVNFNPFATKSKMRQSPPPEMDNPFATKSKIMSSPDSSMIVIQKSETNVIFCDEKIETELMEKDASGNLSNTSKVTDERNITTKEINTEDEDTVEGPFLDSEDLNPDDKISDFDGDNVDMLQFSELPPQSNEENLDNGEMFIDAEAFEFLLNQNKSNTVADSGKESLFLKFDPLFAKRMSAVSTEGVLASLAKLQKKQSTPTKTAPTPPKNMSSPVAGPSNLNVTQDVDMNISEEFNDDLNITVSKPMMVVPPAVNPVTPRNKSITPNRSNRRSITFTSPAMAVIDRLLSLSSNNSLIQDTTVTQVSREQNEADIALSQLRELLAEKEINVYNLKCESNELRDRLNTLEGHVKSLESESEDRLKKINQLTDTLVEKTKINKSMAVVVEEYERTIASLIAETAQDKKKHAEERMKLINERDEQTAHLASMEVSFSDLHSKYEKSKQIILNCKANEEVYRKSIKDFEENLAKMHNNYELLKQHATSKLNHANQELEKINRSHEAEVLKLNAMIKRKELHITSLEESLAQKTKANDELTAICDELINKVG